MNHTELTQVLFVEMQKSVAQKVLLKLAAATGGH